MKIAQDILDIIESGSSEGNQYKLPGVQLDRKTYLAVNKVLTLLGGKWNKKLKAHVFPDSIEDAIDSVLLTGEVRDIKRELQFFETPPELVKSLIKRAEIKPGMFCLEPSAGGGNIVKQLVDIVGRDMVVCYDINQTCVDLLRKEGYRAHLDNFIEKKAIPDSYERIVMNPPFSRQQDIDHVVKALSYLKKGGILVSVMSAGVMYRQNKKTKNFWKLLSNKYDYVKWELPEDSFKASGTKVKTIAIKVWNKFG